MKVEKLIYASFTVISQTAKVMAAVDDKCVVKVEKLLNAYNKIF